MRILARRAPLLPSPALSLSLPLSLALSFAMPGCGGQSGDVFQGGSTPRPSEAASALRQEQFDAAAVSPPQRPSHVDTSGGAWRVIEVPAASNQPRIVRTPSGWLALSSRSIGSSRAPQGWQNALYRSRDGVRWASVPLRQERDDDLQLGDLAYGAGRYVMVGVRRGEGVVWSSSDAVSWRESPQPRRDELPWRQLSYAENRFFGHGFRYLGVSETGESWAQVPISLVQVEAAAYGNGRYLLVGSGPMQTSQDGFSWRAHELDCSLPGACITDPSGGIHQGFHSSALFAEGRFYTEELVSEDGERWRALPGRSPTAYAGGHFLGNLSLSEGLSAWTSGGEPRALRVIRPVRAAVTVAGRDLTSVGVLAHDAPLPDSVDVSFEDGLTCENADCLLVSRRLVLVPPPGTPPLVDRVPRAADGAPLLSDECPVSSMLFCDDYDARTGCVCHPEAPRAPEACEDVSQYRCAGRFTPRGDEWAVSELAQGGCSCDAVDPNQPVGFGSRCAEGSDTCQAPLECLGIEAPPSDGPPLPQPFACTARCEVDADCPSWQATGYCAGAVRLRCSGGACQPRSCE